MSVSTDAVLFYGYCWHEEVDSLFTDPDTETGGGEPEWQELILKKRGMVDPWDSHPEKTDHDFANAGYTARKEKGEAWVQSNRAAIDAWRDAKKAVEEEFGVDVYSHCSGEYSMPYVAIPSTRVLARRGYPAIISPYAMKPPTDAGTRLNAFLDEFGIEKPQESPNWWLVSYWS